MINYKQIAALGIAVSLLGAAITGLELGQRDATAGQKFQNRLIVSPKNVGKTLKVRTGLNKTLLIELPQNATDVVVANPSVADAIMRTPRRAYVLSQEAGQTNLMFFNKSGNPIAIVDVTIDTDTGPLQDMLNTVLPDSSIRVETLNGSIILKGNVKTAADATRAVEIAQSFLVDDETQLINMLSAAGKDQVMIKVTVAEVERQIAKSLGIDLDTSSLTGNFAFAASNTIVDGLGRSGAANRSLGASYTNPTGNNAISGIIDSLDEQGLVKIFSEPTLVAISGEKATFKAVAEIPLIDSREVSFDENNNTIVSTDFTREEIGINLDFTPMVLPGNRINLQIEMTSTEVSPFDGQTLSGAGNVGAATIRSVKRRSSTTTVELPSGGSLAVAGMMQERDQQMINQTPGLGNIPFIGALFRSRSYQNNQTELVIIATAYIVKPVKEDQLSRPTDGLYTSSDLEATLYGRLSKVYGADNVEGANRLTKRRSAYPADDVRAVHTGSIPQNAPQGRQSTRSLATPQRSLRWQNSETNEPLNIRNQYQ